MSQPQSKDGFLAELRKKAEADEQRFLDNIAKRLGRQRVTEKPAHPFQGAPSFWRNSEASLAERIELFLNNWSKVGGRAAHCKDIQEAGQLIVELVREQHATKLLLQQQPELKELKTGSFDHELQDVTLSFWNEEADSLAMAADADIGLIVADYAVAYTGSIVQLSSPLMGRATSLLPAQLIAIIPADRMKFRLGEVMEPIDRLSAAEMPAGIHFISGPSRSADIENDLTIGVHGPGDVCAIVVD